MIYHEKVEIVSEMPYWFNIIKSINAIHCIIILKKNHVIISTQKEFAKF